MKKIIWPGIIAGMAMLIMGMAISYLFRIIPAVAADYENIDIIRSWSNPLMSLIFLYPFVLGIVLALAWGHTSTLFKGTWSARGIKFGLAYLIVATIPGMLISYSSLQLSFLTIVSWTVSGFVNAAIAGMIFAKMNK
jgi:hypothetical protein